MIDVLVPLYIEKNSDLEGKLNLFQGNSVQLSFTSYGNFRQIDHRDLKQKLSDKDIAVKSFHLPKIDVIHKHFLDTLKLLQDQYHRDIFTLHPQNLEYKIAVQEFQKLFLELVSRGIVLAYENFPRETKKWIKTPQEICSLDFPFTELTLDTSHLDLDYSLMEQIITYLGKTKVVHLSDNLVNGENFSIHLPVGKGNLPLEKFMDFLQIHYDGQVVLDYGSDYIKEMFEDQKKISKILDRSYLETKFYLDSDWEDEKKPEEVQGKMHWKTFYKNGERVRKERYTEQGKNDYIFTFLKEGDIVNKYIWENKKFIYKEVYKYSEMDIGYGTFARYNSSGKLFERGKL